jgi:hypothetical protein
LVWGLKVVLNSGGTKDEQATTARKRPGRGEEGEAQDSKKRRTKKGKNPRRKKKK